MNKKLIILIVNLAIPLGGISTDIYLPALPNMAHYFHVSNTPVQLTITLYTLGLGIGQCIIGPISDAAGRKYPLLVGLVLQLLAVIFIVQTSSIIMLIVVRLIQGLGAAFMMVSARALLNDIFEGLALKRHYTYITASFAIGPIIAPFIGSYLQYYMGWRSCFYFILFYALLLMTLCVFFLKETIIRRKSFSLNHVGSSYGCVIKNKTFFVSAILTSFFMSYTAIFNITGPFMIQDVLHKSAIFYGYIALFMGAGWFIGNMISRIFLLVNIRLKSIIVLFLMALNAIMMFFVSIGYMSVITLILPVFFMILLAGFLFPIYVSECLSLFREQAASANGLLFSFIWLIYSLFTLLGSLLKVYTFIPIAICFIIISLFSVFWYLVMVRKYI